MIQISLSITVYIILYDQTSKINKSMSKEVERAAKSWGWCIPNKGA